MTPKTEPNARRAILRRNLLSKLLTRSVRLLLSPFTLIYLLLVALWSLPFRLREMYVRAKNPFLCSEALTMYLDEGDRTVTFWDLYCCFRHHLLSRTDSFFNAYYVRLSERAYTDAIRPKELSNLPEHPLGWYSSPRRVSIRRGAMLRLRMLEGFLRVFLFLPSRLSAFFRRAAHATENSRSALGGVLRLFYRKGGAAFPVLLLIVVGVVIGYRASMPLSFAVRLGEETIGYVESRQVLADALRETENSVSDALGVTFKFPQNISYAVAKVKSPTYLSKSELVEALSTYTADYVRVGYALYVDGTLTAVSEHEGKLRALLSEAEACARKNGNNDELKLLNDARILYQNCPADAFLSDEEIDGLLTSMQEGGGKTAMTLSAYVPASIPVASTLSQGEAYCYTIRYEGEEAEQTQTVSLVFGESRVEEEREAVAYSTTYRESDTIYEGAQYVHQRGVMGEKLISYTVYYSGDREYSREVLSEATLTEPIDQIVLIGTKPLPTLGADTDTQDARRIFIAPVYGEIYSPFGLRDFDDDGVLDSAHSGIDIPAPEGTPLYAAGDGVVTEAGDSGSNYGLVVEILHENGLYTHYSHLSAVTVKVGQAVSQNQMIGNVGTTGFVTGAHVHFEVRLPSGKQVDPELYLIGY